jgi:hypothetical protein
MFVNAANEGKRGYKIPDMKTLIFADYVIREENGTEEKINHRNLIVMEYKV